MNCANEKKKISRTKNTTNEAVASYIGFLPLVLPEGLQVAGAHGAGHVAIAVPARRARTAGRDEGLQHIGTSSRRRRRIIHKHGK